jgi:hypothetical protein
MDTNPPQQQQRRQEDFIAEEEKELQEEQKEELKEEQKTDKENANVKGWYDAYQVPKGFIDGTALLEASDVDEPMDETEQEIACAMLSDCSDCLKDECTWTPNELGCRAHCNPAFLADKTKCFEQADYVEQSPWDKMCDGTATLVKENSQFCSTLHECSDCVKFQCGWTTDAVCLNSCALAPDPAKCFAMTDIHSGKSPNDICQGATDHQNHHDDAADCSLPNTCGSCINSKPCGWNNQEQWCYIIPDDHQDGQSIASHQAKMCLTECQDLKACMPCVDFVQCGWNPTTDKCYTLADDGKDGQSGATIVAKMCFDDETQAPANNKHQHFSMECVDASPFSVGCQFHQHPYMCFGFFFLVLPCLIIVLLRRRLQQGRDDSRGEYRTVAEGMRFDNTFSDDYSADGEDDFSDLNGNTGSNNGNGNNGNGDVEESWSKSGKRVIEMGNMGGKSASKSGSSSSPSEDELSLEEMNG